MRPLAPPAAAPSPSPVRSTEGVRGRRVYILARKALRRNSRIFRQAESLSRAGYDVLLIGVKSRDTVEVEWRDGYTIRRIALLPLHGRIPRGVSKALRLTEGALRSVGGTPPVRGVVAVPVVGPPAHALLTHATERTAAVVHVANDRVTGWLTRELGRIAFPLRSWEYYKRAYRLVGADLPIPDVFHANDLDTLLVGVLLARRYGRKLVYDAQELYTGMHSLPSWYRAWLRLQERLLIRRADRVIVVNDAIAEVIEARYGRRVDSVVMNCPPYDATPERHDGVTIREYCGLAPEAKVMVYSGGLASGRGLENAIRALEYLREWTLVFLGEGPIEDELRTTAERAQLAGRVRFAPFVPHREVPHFISSATVGIVPYENVGPNHYLCSPSKLFHYMMAEVPIVCSDFPFLRAVVAGHNIGATFEPTDPRRIAAAVREVTDDPARYDEIRARLRTLKHHYCWERQEERMLTVYRSLTPELGR